MAKQLGWIMQRCEFFYFEKLYLFLTVCKDCPDGIIPEDLYRRACVSSAEEATEVCARIGLPVMIKASEGGGGKGIRKVINSVDVASSFRQVRFCCPLFCPTTRCLTMEFRFKRRFQALQFLL